MRLNDAFGRKSQVLYVDLIFRGKHGFNYLVVEKTKGKYKE